jgi:hypothetical protein
MKEKTDAKYMKKKQFIYFVYILVCLLINLFYLQTSQNFGGPLCVLVMELLLIAILGRILK